MNTNYKLEPMLILPFLYPLLKVLTRQLKNIVFITYDDIHFPCACDVSSLIRNRSTANSIWFEETTRINESPSVDQLILTKNTETEDFVRGKIVAVNVEDETLQYLPNKKYRGEEIQGAYIKDTRILSQLEYVYGYDDIDNFLAPFRCSEGSATQVENHIVEVDSYCNCTQIFPAEETSCACSDGVDEWQCLCNAEECDCDEDIVKERYNSLLFNYLSSYVEDCDCLVYKNNPITVIDGVKIGNDYVFNYLDQAIAEKIIVEDCSSLDDWNVTLLVSNAEFSEFNYTLDYFVREDGCNKTLYLEYFNDINVPYNRLLMKVNHNETFETVPQLIFQSDGFALRNTEEPTVTASNYPGLTNITFPWNSDLTKINWLKYSFVNEYIIDYVEVSFINTGITIVGELRNQPIELQVSSDNVNWFIIGIFYTKGANDVQHMNLTTPNANEFSIYRLFSHEPFGVKNFDLYSNQDCDFNCNMTLSLESTNGLKTYKDWLDSIAYQENNLKSNETCIAEDNCFITMGGGPINVTANGICNDALYVSDNLGLSREKIINVTSTLTVPANIQSYNVDILPGVTAIQFSNSTSSFYNDSQLIDYYDDYKVFIPMDPNITDLYIIYTETGTDNVLPISPFNAEKLYVNQSFEIIDRSYYYEWELLTAADAVCAPGMDATDCGPSNRIPTLMNGYDCTLNETALLYLEDTQNKTSLFTRITYIVNDFSVLSDPYSVNLHNIYLPRERSIFLPKDCGGYYSDDPKNTLPV